MLNPTVTTPPEFDHAGIFVILSHFDTRCGHITTRDTLCFNLVLKTNSNSCTVDHPLASSSNVATLSSCTTPAVFEQDLPTPGPQPNRVHFSIYVDTRDIVLTRGNPSFASLSGLIRVPMFTFRSQDTLRQFRVDDVKQKLSDYIWQHVHLDIRTSDFVILCNPSLATRHRWTPGLLKLNYTSTWYEVLHQLDLPLNTPTLLLETCTTSQWQWMQDHQLSSTPRLISPGCIPGALPDPELLRGDVTDVTVVLGPHVLVSSQIEPNNKMDNLNGKIIVDSLTIGELIAIFWTQIWCMVWRFRERSLALALVGHWA